MTYKHAVDMLRRKLMYEYHKNKLRMPDIEDFELLSIMSRIQQDLNSQYRLKLKYKTEAVAQGSTSHIFTDIFVENISHVAIIDDLVNTGGVEQIKTTPLLKTSVTEIEITKTYDGRPTKWAEDKDTESKILLNKTTDVAYNIVIEYLEKSDTVEDKLAMDPGGDETSIDWNDYDIEIPASYGGSFKLKPNWHSIIVWGAFVEFFPAYYQMYLRMIEQTLKTRSLNVNSSLFYNIK